MSKKLQNMFEQQQPVKSQEKVELNVLDKYRAKTKKPTVEETHTRTTFLIEDELLEQVNKLAKGKHGFKTMFYNEAIKKLLKELGAYGK